MMIMMRDHLRPQTLLAGEEIGETLQNDIERTGRFAGADHADIQRVEQFGVSGHGIGKAGTLADLGLNISERGFEHFLFGLIGERRQTFDERNRGFLQCAKLAGEILDILFGNAGSDLKIERFFIAIGFRAGFFFCLAQIDARLEQRIAKRCLGCGFLNAFDLFSVACEGLVFIKRHGLSEEKKDVPP